MAHCRQVQTINFVSRFGANKNDNMKKLLTLLAFFVAFSASAQSYISSDTNIILEVGSPKQYASPNIFVHGEYYARQGVWLLVLQLTPTIFSASAGAYQEFSIRLDKATVDGYTGTGTGDTAKIQNALEQAVGGYLGAFNPSTTFTIH